MTKKQKKQLIRIIVTIVVLFIVNLIPTDRFFGMLLFLIPYLIIGYDILRKAFLGVIHGQIFDENFLMAIATVGAYIIALIRTGEYNEAVAVMLFYQVGEFFQSYAVGKSRKSISDLMDIRPEYANIEVDGRLERRDPDEIAVGSIISVLPGEKIPIDGIVIDGKSNIDTAALTGESIPRDVSVGDTVLSGCINMTGILKIQTTKVFGESSVSKILNMVENASSRKSKPEAFVSKFARYYTPVVCLGALLLAVLPPLIRVLFLGLTPNFGEWIYRSLTFLVISCPCALVISIPLTFFAGIGGASRVGVLIKGSNYFEPLAKVGTVVFDKTGTLTKGKFEVSEIHPENCTEREILAIAAIAESSSNHPIAKSLVEAYGESVDRNRVCDIKEFGGNGITAVIDGKQVAVGNARLMQLTSLSIDVPDVLGTVVHVSCNGLYYGYIRISDTVKESAEKSIKTLKTIGVSDVVMLTGDSESAAGDISEILHIDRFYSQLLPNDKVEIVEQLICEKQKKTVLFVGDGVNDAPVLACADVGVAMGGMGSDAAIESADVVIMDDDPAKVATAIKIARKCIGIAYQNIICAIGVKVVCLVLGAMGKADMWLAIFADVGVMVIAVLNAMRALFEKE